MAQYQHVSVEVLSVPEFAAWARISEAWAWKLVARREVLSVKRGRRRLIPKDAAFLWLFGASGGEEILAQTAREKPKEYADMLAKMQEDKALSERLNNLWTKEGEAVLRRAAEEKPEEFQAMINKLMGVK